VSQRLIPIFTTRIEDCETKSSPIVGYYTSGLSDNHGFLYSGGVYTTLDDPAGSQTAAQGINDAGQIVGFYGNGNANDSHGFLYSGGVYTTLDDPLATGSTLPQGINATGQIVGNYNNGAALQSVIQTLGKPWYRRRALRVFRDDTGLAATPSLWDTIEQALGQSRYLILLASPEAAASPWVRKCPGFGRPPFGLGAEAKRSTVRCASLGGRTNGTSDKQIAPSSRGPIAHLCQL
jgi:probable HAF family extracellular repeat protein